MLHFRGRRCFGFLLLLLVFRIGSTGRRAQQTHDASHLRIQSDANN